MKVHEYQAREVLQAAGVPVPRFKVISSASEAPAAYTDVGGGRVVVKAQVHAGGRGKAGYVVLCDNAADVQAICKRMFSEPMVSKQTGPGGVAVHRILIAPAVEIAK